MEKNNPSWKEPNSERGIPFEKKNRGYVITSVITASVFYFYSSFALAGGSLDYRKWPEIQEKRELKARLNHDNNVSELFRLLDIDGDGSLNEIEFKQAVNFPIYSKDYKRNKQTSYNIKGFEDE